MPPRRVSTDPKPPAPQSRDTTPADFKAAFLARIKASREAMLKDDGKPWSQTDMAERLGMTQDKYKQYETRSMMPTYLVVEFCRITDQHPWYILTGQSGSRAPGTVPPRPPANLRTVPPAKPKSRPSK
jgi:hypothetical protein